MVTGEMIKAARERLGQSQAEFAKRFGVDQSAVSRWETQGLPARGPAEKMVERVLADLAQEAAE
jgi:DNA-binding transcriptional regulator YiaG